MIYPLFYDFFVVDSNAFVARLKTVGYHLAFVYRWTTLV